MSVVQKFLLELDALTTLEEYLPIVIKTTLCVEEIAVKVVKPERAGLELPPVLLSTNNSLPVILISGWYLPRAAENHYFGGYKPWNTFQYDGVKSATDQALTHVLGLLEENFGAWSKTFSQKFGNGYHSGFLPSDGHVQVGFKLQTCGCFPEQLAVSLVHIYYGK
jgi:hypothetical protein